MSTQHTTQYLDQLKEKQFIEKGTFIYISWERGNFVDPLFYFHFKFKNNSYFSF